jgi:hypothetical protein
VFKVYHRRRLTRFRILCRWFSLSRKECGFGHVRWYIGIPSLEQIVGNSEGDQKVINESDRKPHDEHPVHVFREGRPLRITGAGRVAMKLEHGVISCETYAKEEAANHTDVSMKAQSNYASTYRIQKLVKNQLGYHRYYKILTWSYSGQNSLHIHGMRL